MRKSLAIFVVVVLGSIAVPAQMSKSRAEGGGSLASSIPADPAASGAVRGDVPAWVVGTVTNPPFSLRDHFALGTPARACADVLSRAAVWQDVLHAASSAAHFDNCAFDDSLEYIAALEREAGDLLRAATARRTASGGMGEAALRQAHAAVFLLGQALHAVQDFYSHSNFVELEEARVADLAQAERLKFFGGGARSRIQAMVASGSLHSGTWRIGSPKRCLAGTLAHADLAKDHADSGKGVSKTRWGRSYHFAALILARASTESYLDDATRAWPILAEVCNPPYGLNSPREQRKEP